MAHTSEVSPLGSTEKESLPLAPHLETEQKRVVWQEYLRLSQALSAAGYEIVIAGRMADAFQNSATSTIILNDLDGIVLSRSGGLIDSAAVVKALKDAGYPDVTSLPKDAILKKAVESNYNSGNYSPESIVVTTTFANTLTGEATSIELFLGNEFGAGYQQVGVMNNRSESFTLADKRAQIFLDSGSERVAALSYPALIAYYLSILKLPRFLELLEVTKGKWSSNFEAAAALSPQINAQMEHITWMIIFTGLDTLQRTASEYTNSALVVARYQYILQTDTSPYVVLAALEKLTIERSSGNGEPQAAVPLSDILLQHPEVLGQLLKESEDSTLDLSANVLFCLTNTGSLNAGEVVAQLKVDPEKITALLSQLVQHPLVQTAFVELVNTNNSNYLKFHSYAHAVDVAIKGVCLALELGVLPDASLSDKALALFMSLLFHDIGMMTTLSAAKHEATSIFTGGLFLRELKQNRSLSKLMTDSLYQEIWCSLAGILGTKLTFTKESVTSPLELSDEAFIALLEQELASIPQSQVPEGDRLQIIKIITDLCKNHDTWMRIKDYAQASAIADIIGLATEKSFWGTADLSLEALILKGHPYGLVLRTPQILEALQRIVALTGDEKLISFVQGPIAEENKKIIAELLPNISQSEPASTCMAKIAELARKKYYPGVMP